MSTEEQVIKAKRVLQKAVDAGNTTRILEVMQQLYKVKATESLLKKTDIGRTLGKLRTDENAEISRKAKEIVRKWKDDVVMATRSKPKSASSTTSSTPASNNASPPGSNPPSRSSSVSSAADAGPPRTIKTDEVDIETTGSVPRDKTIELMYAAVALGSGASSDLLLKRAIEIEKTLFDDFGAANDGYKNKVRSLALNLKNKSNPGLRESVVSGELPVKKLCKMTIEEMQSEEAKARDQKLAEEALFKARGAGSAQAETDMFMCGKCKNRRCTYFQMQTRSADEPMTTFVTCVSCGNRWKFC